MTLAQIQALASSTSPRIIYASDTAAFYSIPAGSSGASAVIMDKTASPTFTGTVTLPASTSLTTPVLGAATGTSLAIGGANPFSSAPFSVKVSTDNNFQVFNSGGLHVSATNDANNQYITIVYDSPVRFSGVLGQTSAAPTIASATTITAASQIIFISGTTPIATINPPNPINIGGGQIALIPTGIWTTTTAGNIALASTAVVNKAMIMTFDSATVKWYPSY